MFINIYNFYNLIVIVDESFTATKIEVTTKPEELYIAWDR